MFMMDMGVFLLLDGVMIMFMHVGNCFMGMLVFMHLAIVFMGMLVFDFLMAVLVFMGNDVHIHPPFII
jgi:hypothetical protein